MLLVLVFVNVRKLHISHSTYIATYPYQFIAYVHIIKVHVCHDGRPSHVACVVELMYTTRSYSWRVQRLTCVHGMQTSLAFTYKHVRFKNTRNQEELQIHMCYSHACVKFKLSCTVFYESTDIEIASYSYIARITAAIISNSAAYVGISA